MAEKIKNKKEVLLQGAKDSKKIVLDLAEKTLQQLDGYYRVK